MLNFEKNPGLRNYLRGVLERRSAPYRSKKAFEKELSKYGLLDPTEIRQELRQQKHLESIEKELQAGGAR